MTKKITVTMRDMYMEGTDTVELEGKMAEAYLKSPDKSKFLANLETVVFTTPYIVGRK
jgi:hypothetical protein